MEGFMDTRVILDYRGKKCNCRGAMGTMGQRRHGMEGREEEVGIERGERPRAQ